MRLAAIVILFQPNLKATVGNILSFIEDVDQVVLYLNSPVAIADVESLKPYMDKVTLLGNGVNIGIAAALNRGVEWSMKHNYTHVLTMDQDSSFLPGNLSRFKELVDKTDLKNVGAYAPNPDNRGILCFETSLPYLEVPDTITSGTIFPVNVFTACGLFEEALFIDAVDYEFCYRIKKRKGYKTIIFTNVVLSHEVGYPTTINFGFVTDNYSAFRTYFIVRNHIIIWRRYPDLFQPQYKRTLIKIHIVYRLAKILIGEADKIGKIKAIFMGIIHGSVGRLGFYKV